MFSPVVSFANVGKMWDISVKFRLLTHLKVPFRDFNIICQQEIYMIMNTKMIIKHMSMLPCRFRAVVFIVRGDAAGKLATLRVCPPQSLEWHAGFFQFTAVTRNISQILLHSDLLSKSCHMSGHMHTHTLKSVCVCVCVCVCGSDSHMVHSVHLMTENICMKHFTLKGAWMSHFLPVS